MIVVPQTVLGPREVLFCSNVDFFAQFCSAHIRSSEPFSQRVHDRERKIASFRYLARINKYLSSKLHAKFQSDPTTITSFKLCQISVQIISGHPLVFSV